MRAMWSVRPKRSHRCVSLKEGPLEPVQILQHTTKNSTEPKVMRTKWFKHIAIQIVQAHLLQEPKQEPQTQEIARKVPKTFLNYSRTLHNKTRVLRQIAPTISPESLAKSLSRKFFGVPLLSLIMGLMRISTTTTQRAKKENLQRQAVAPSTPTVDMEML